MECNSRKKASLVRPNLTKSGMIRASVATAGDMLARVRQTGYGRALDYDCRALTKSDVAILRFLAAVELIESDLWLQYEELGGVTEGPQNPYQLALQFLDTEASQFVTSNTLDEIGHSAYLNAYLEAEGAEPVDIDQFRTLRGSRATGAQNIGRLTNLKHLDMDTQWYVQYRSVEDADCGRLSPAATLVVNQHAIPRTDSDLERPSEVQAIANTAAFHFGYIEYLVSRVYATISQKLKRAKVLKVALGIGGGEIDHFFAWVDLAGNVVHKPPFKAEETELSATNDCSRESTLKVIVKGRCEYLNLDFVIPAALTNERRPYTPFIGAQSADAGGAVATAYEFLRNGLFAEQSSEFLRTLFEMAREADNALTQ